MLKLLYLSFPMICCYAQENKTLPTEIYCDHSSCVNFDSARRSKIEAKRSERGRPFPVGKADEEDRFGKVAARQNSHNLSGRSINSSFLLAIRFGIVLRVINSSTKIYAYVITYPHEEHIFTC